MLFSLLILFGWLFIIGFLYAWVIGLVANEEVGILKGAITVVVGGFVGSAVMLGLEQITNERAWWLPFVRVPIDFAAITVSTQLLNQIGWKKSAMSAAVFSGVLFAIGLLLSLIL